MSRSWDLRGFYYVQDDQFYAHSGFPDKASYVGLLNRLQADDFVEIDISLHLQQFDASNLQATDPAHRSNALIFQFSREPTPVQLNFQTNDFLDLQGLVVFIINEDRGEPSRPTYKPYFVTYRFFATRTRLRKDYVNMLIEPRSEFTRRRDPAAVRVA